MKIDINNLSISIDVHVAMPLISILRILATFRYNGDVFLIFLVIGKCID